MSLPTTAGTAPRFKPLSIAAIGLTALALLFALLAIEHALALAAGRVDLQTQLIAWLTSNAFIFGEGSIQYVVPWYRQAMLRMTLHMTLGGIALGLGVLQFVPSLRRRYPLWHRRSGLLVWIATFASMASAIGFLTFVPMNKGASGAVFHLGLWALSGLTLLLLWQAILAALSRDFRSHMVWMALVFAALATAPALRVDWVVFGQFWAGHGHETVNLATGTFVLLQTLLVMTLWLSWCGDRDLPSRPAPRSAVPGWLVALLAALSALAAVQEGLLARIGLDLYAAARDARDLLPLAGGALWGLAMLAAMLTLPAAWGAALLGERPSRRVSLAIAAVALGAGLIGLEHDRSSLARFASATFWLAYAVALLLALLLAHSVRPNSTGRNAWSLITLATLWLPSQLGGLIAIGLAVGARFDEAMAAALVNGSGGIVVAGIAVGFGARLRLAPTPRAKALSAHRNFKRSGL